ncbi:MAG: dihydropteroate synthase [Desulfobacterales bacterium]|nr:dihydropteroate synthase [Desulfobacterales bacterium]
METRISSAARQVIIGPDRPTVLIGERINPAGKKKMAQAVLAGRLEIVAREAQAQERAGADIVDICVSAFGVDEAALLPRAVEVVMDATDVPLCLDSSSPAALEAALKVYTGKALINSVTGEEHSLARILPLVKTYGAAVIGLTQDDDGISRDPERRVAVAHKIVQRAEAAGIAREDILIDCLALAVGADAGSGRVTLETIRMVRESLGVNLVLGASNISFGLPLRDVLNSAFVVIVSAAGVNSLIVDAAKVRQMILAADLVLGRDVRARRYIEAYRRRDP